MSDIFCSPPGIVERLEFLAAWIKETQPCCGELDSAGICCAPACSFGDRMKTCQEGADIIRDLRAQVAALLKVKEAAEAAVNGNRGFESHSEMAATICMEIRQALAAYAEWEKTYGA